jgi:hypothetical protein
MKLAAPAALERLCQSVAVLEAILSPEWQYRYYSFNRKWAPGQRMASMRDGGGEHWFLLFREGLAFLKGYEHERPRGSLERVPAVFAPELAEPAFLMQDVTFCAWSMGEGWHGDTSSGLLLVLDASPETYAGWASDYYEVPVDVQVVRRVYAGEPVTGSLVRALNPGVALEGLGPDLDEIGYPF